MAHLAGRKSFQQPKCSSAILRACTLNCSERLLAFSWATELPPDPHCVGNEYAWIRMENQASKNMFSNVLWFFHPSFHPKESFLESQCWTVNWGNWGSVPICVLILKTAILFPRWKKRCVPFPAAHSSDWLMMHAQEENKCLSKNYFPYLWEEQAVLFFFLIPRAESSAFTLNGKRWLCLMKVFWTA